VIGRASVRDAGFCCAHRLIRKSLQPQNPRKDSARHHPRRDHDTAANLRSGRTQAFATWADVTGVAMAA
jgi:hypothetical protein